MDIMTAARHIGLIGDDGGTVFGTIERGTVVAMLQQLAAASAADADLFTATIARVERGRSAGVEKLSGTDFLGRADAAGEVQLRYRAEMADLFMDLAIDLGIRHSARQRAGV